VHAITAPGAYTNHGARLLRMDDRLGSIEAGMYADLVVLSNDLLTVPEAGIREIHALATLVAGRPVQGGAAG